MSLQSALIGFLLSKFLPKPITAQENVVLQTTAVATGTVRATCQTCFTPAELATQMPLAAGFVGILPALGLLDEERDGVPPIHLSWIAAVGWSCAVAFFGCVPHLYVGETRWDSAETGFNPSASTSPVLSPFFLASAKRDALRS